MKEISKILITDGFEKEPLEKLSSLYEVTCEELSSEELVEKIFSYDALVVRSRTKVSKEVIENGRKLKIIARAGVGVDNIDIETATKYKVIVINAPTASTISVAELTIGHIISLARKLHTANHSVREGKWEKKSFLGIELDGKILGFIGSGKIGIEVANRMQSFGMKCISYDPYLNAEIAKKHNIKLTSLEDVLRNADFITIHAPLTKETYHLIGENELAKMKPSAYIINCARGGIVDENALYKFLAEKRIAGAALDVYEKEPPKNSPLLKLDNVVFSPHIGASTKEAQLRACSIIAEQLIKFFSNQRVDFVVNRELIEK